MEYYTVTRFTRNRLPRTGTPVYHTHGIKTY